MGLRLIDASTRWRLRAHATRHPLPSAHLTIGEAHGSAQHLGRSAQVGRRSGAIGTTFCPAAVANSTGSSATPEAIGQVSLAENDLTLGSSSLPPNAFSLLFVSQSMRYQTQPGISFGAICLDDSVGLYVGPGQVQTSGVAGAFELALDLDDIPQPLGAVMGQAGETWLFQAGYCNMVGGMPASNFTDAVCVGLLP